MGLIKLVARVVEIERERAELHEFGGEVMVSLHRKDQRAKGGLYLRWADAGSSAQADAADG